MPTTPENDELYRTFFEAAPDACYISDIKGTFIDGNRAAEELVGYRREELIGRNMLDVGLIPASQILRATALLARAALGQTTGPDEFILKHKDGREIPADIRTQPVTIAGRRLVLGIARDVKTRVDAKQEIEDELRKNEEKYRAVVDQSTEYIYLIDSQTLRVVEANPAFRRMLGYSVAELAELKLHDLVDAPRESIDVNIAKVLRDGALFIGPRRYRCKDGSLVDAELSVNQITYGGRDVMCVVARDVRERITLEEQLRQAQKMEAVGTLAGGVAHDFNNLLFVISGRCDVALKKIAREDDAKAEIEDAALAAERATELTQQLLAFSRKQVLRPRVLDLNATMSKLERILGRLIGEDIAMRVDLARDLRSVKADPGQIEQVVMNLAVNARDAMPDGGTLTIATRAIPDDDPAIGQRHGLEPGPLAEIRVSDDGVGIDAAVRARMFEPFFTTKASGSGLGLSTVYGIVKQSGGSIEVESATGRGTSFRIFLPTVEGQGEHPTPLKTPQPPPQPGCETILVVEDDPMTRRLVVDVLGETGYRVLEAASAEEALDLHQRADPPVDLLLTDLVLPQMNGRELGERLSAAEQGIRVLFMSGYTDDADTRRHISERSLSFLEKPFTPAELLSRIRAQLDESAAKRRG
jgi:PAS domain S-box-containing protein